MHENVKYLHHLLKPNSKKWHPFLGVFYLNFQCNFSCTYCSDGHGEPYFKKQLPLESADTIINVLKALRTECDVLEITGGEPLLHPQIEEVLAYIPTLNFKQTILTTNGYYLDKYAKSIEKCFDTIVISLDTLDPEKANKLMGLNNCNNTSHNTYQKVLDNITLAKSLDSKVVISSVITPDNIYDVQCVMDFALSQGLEFAAYPQLVGVKRSEKLAHSTKYLRLVELMIQNKKQGEKIFPTLASLELMKQFSDFRCRPFTIVSLQANGDVYYPCLEIANIAGNILSHSLKEIKENGHKTFGPISQYGGQFCGAQCHSACSMGFSQILNHPSSMIAEGKSLWKRRSLQK